MNENSLCRGSGGLPSHSHASPLTVPSPARLGGGGRSPRSSTAGEAHGVCPGSTARTAPQPWLVPGLCMVSPTSTLSPPARPNKSFQLMLGQSLAHQDTPLFGSLCLFRGFDISVPCLPSDQNAQRGNHFQALPLQHSLPPGNQRDHGIPEISANGVGSPLYRLASLPKYHCPNYCLSAVRTTLDACLEGSGAKM